MTQKANLPLYIYYYTFKKRKLEYFFKNQSVYHMAFMKKSSFNINHTMQIHPSVLGTKYVPTYKILNVKMSWQH